MSNILQNLHTKDIMDAEAHRGKDADVHMDAVLAELATNHMYATGKILTTATTTDSETNVQQGQPPSQAQISSYQIFLWTCLVLGTILGSAVYALLAMSQDVQPDSILFAKFISGRAKTE